MFPDVSLRREDMKSKTALVLAVGLALAPQRLAAQNILIDGQVVKTDLSAGKITIKHGPAPKLGMDEGMTMVYKVQDPKLLGAVKAGDKIKFDADQVNGQYTVTRIERPK
jgi:Cu(I)/Ag(I) efflux system periplasmic protein CusF